MTINKEERAYFAGFGERVAQLCKQRGITQVQLAQALNVSQQTIQAYEVVRRRIPASNAARAGQDAGGDDRDAAGRTARMCFRLRLFGMNVA